MRILILGGDGMMGHQLFKHLRHLYDVRVTLRQDLSAYLAFGLFDEGSSYTGIDVRSIERVKKVLDDFQPHVVVNAAGIVKQRSAAKESIPSLEINALFPHRLSLLCKAIGARMVQFSTDCVFSGRKGNYQESDPSDAEDLYGKTKYLGEVQDKACITLRTSIIGKELSRKLGLLEWFFAQSGVVPGYNRAIFSGFTTLEMNRIIERILVDYPEKEGLYHVSSEPISKFDFLTLIKEKMGLATEIIADETVQYDRSLDSTRFRKEFNYTPPTWEEMVEELCKSLTGEEI
jgi:dTDP-4-dehydrorhamnose reductase